MSLAPGEVIDNRYVVERVLGQGGMAVVYQVRHLKLDTQYALKVLSVPSGSIRQRLLQEGRVQASLRHPNIVAVTDVVEVDGAPGLVMEFVEGDTLEALVQARRLTYEQIDDLANGVISGVQEAHRRGLIHRDLKPANILLSKAGGRFTPKVADFGLAKILTDEGGVTRTRSGMMMGTPAYMAPEQSKNAKAVDQRADVFALGAILYEMVCGRRAFEGEDLVDVLTAARQESYVPPRQIRPDVPDRFEKAIEGALRADATRRIPDCTSLLAILQGRTASKDLWGDVAEAAAGPSMTAVPASLGDREPTQDTWGEAASPLSSGPEPGPQRADPAQQVVHLAEQPIVVAAREVLALPEGSLAPRASQATMAESLAPASLPPQQSPATVSPPTDSVVSFAPEPRRGIPVAGFVALAAMLGAAFLVGGLAFVSGTFGPQGASQQEGVLPVGEVPTAPAATPPAPVTSEAAPPATSQPPEGPAPQAAASPIGASEGHTAKPAIAPTTPGPASKAKAPSQTTASAASASTASTEKPRPAETKAAEAPAQDGEIHVSGVDRVWLVSATGRYPPGRVPAGTYDVQVFFDPARPTSAGTVTIATGEVRTLKCVPDLKVCR